MLRILLIILSIIAVCFSHLNAQDFWEQTATIPGSLSLGPMIVNEDGHLFVGTKGDPSGNGVFRSTDNGETWTQSGLSGLFIWDLAINSSGHIFAGTMNQGVYRSINNGETWAQINNGFHQLDNSVYSLAIHPDGNIYAGAVNSIYVSVNNGNSWTALNSPPSNGFAPMLITPNGYIFSGAASARIYRSTNGGSSWVSVFEPSGIVQTMSTNFLGHLFVGNLTGVFRSTDYGDSWGNIDQDLNISFFNVARAIVQNSVNRLFVGLAGTSSQGVYRSVNNGDSWVLLNSGLSHKSVSCLAIDQNDIMFAGTTNGNTFRSTSPTNSLVLNQTLSNLNIPFSNTQQAVSTISFQPPGNKQQRSFLYNTVSVQIIFNEVLHTRTGDLTFTLEHHGVTQTLIFEAGADGQNFISTVLGDENVIPIENGSAPFTGYYKPSNPLNVFSGSDPYGDWTLTITDGYAGNEGILNSWSLIIEHDGSTSIDAEIEIVPNNFELFQNYPNPFNPLTSIRYQVSGISQVSLKVFDLLGREVATLVNEEKPAGTYEINVDGAGFSSGVYFYQLKAGNEFIETKKLVLVK